MCKTMKMTKLSLVNKFFQMIIFIYYLNELCQNLDVSWIKDRTSHYKKGLGHAV